MPPADPPITLTVSADKLSQREQIEQVLERTTKKGDPMLRIRIPFTLYDQTDGRGYLQIREAAWNMQLPVALTTPEHIEKLIYTLGRCIVQIATEGSDSVLEKLETR